MKNNKDIYSSLPGDKIKFNRTGAFWFTDMVANGNKLTKGAVYTVKKIIIHNSYTTVVLDETGDLEYNLGWFKAIC
jgi:hypothetical protein